MWLRDEAVIVRDPQTGKRLTRGMLIDITERKRAEEALRRSEENYRMFVAQSSEGIFRQDLDAPCRLTFRKRNWCTASFTIRTWPSATRRWPKCTE